MSFGERVTRYEQYSTGTYGYIIKIKTVPEIRKVTLIQAKTSSKLSEAIETETEIKDLLNYSENSEAPELAYAYQAGLIYVYLDSSEYAYEDATRLLLIGFRYPFEITDLDSTLDIIPEDLELFTTLAQVIGYELEGRPVPQKIMNKAEYFQRLINLE